MPARPRRAGRGGSRRGGTAGVGGALRELYERLGVAQGASSGEVQRAYRKLSRLLHPDLNPGDDVAARRYAEVSFAFTILSDPARRAAYDRGEAQDDPSARRPRVGFEGFDFNAEPGAHAGFREIFAPQGEGRAQESRGEPGEELEHTTRISFAESLKGTRRRIHLVRYDACPVCRGQGEVVIDPAPCPRCGGSGRVRASRGHMVFSRDCDRCDGSGRVEREGCGRCSAEGRLMRSEFLEIEIPPGVGDGSRVRLSGCGNVGRRGGEPGDFVLVVEVEKHDFFRRDGEDLHCTVPLSITEAALGGHVEVPTPEGSVRIEVPAGTQSGHRFRLRKRGVPRLDGSGRGDLYVEASIWVPTITEGRERELLEELARLETHDPRAQLSARGTGDSED